jgi:dienelactone hydrolase
VLMIHGRSGFSAGTLADAEMIAKVGYVVFAEDSFGNVTASPFFRCSHHAIRNCCFAHCDTTCAELAPGHTRFSSTASQLETWEAYQQ